MSQSPSGDGRPCRWLLPGDIQNADSHVAPKPDLISAIRAGDDALIRGTGWNRNPIAAAMAAPERIVVYLDRLGHGGASVSDWRYGQHYTPKQPALQRARIAAYFGTGVS
jgi:hypothetical protein